MADYPIPFDEDHRLQVLRALALDDAEATPEYDRLVDLATKHFRTKIALVSIVDAERQCFHAAHGIDATETPRKVAFCAHAIMQREAFTVLDATRDPRFRDNPLVTGPPHIRFYAGKPLLVDGAAIGTFCIIDDQPRAAFTPDDETALDTFARLVVDEIRLRQCRLRAAADIGAQLDEAHRLAAAGATAKAQFLATMSHELRTPLNAVIGFAECISGEVMGAINPPVYRELAAQIVAGGRRQVALIDRLLEVSDSGEIAVADATIDVADLAATCVASLAGEALAAGVTVEAAPPTAPLRLTADPLHTEQILRELLSNAIKFTPKGGRIGVSYGVEGDGRICIAIRDSGVGIAPSALGDAMAVFGRLETGRVTQGAGIGLPIVKKLADLHGAELSLTRCRTGGTRAVVRFPAYRTDAAALRGRRTG